MAKIRTHYDNLKVARNAPAGVIKAAYKALCQTYHPDKFQGTKEEAERIMKIINASYAVLIDPVKRKMHDSWIEEQEEKAKQEGEKAQFSATSEATEKQYYQAQGKHDIPKTEEPCSYTDSNTRSESANIPIKQRQLAYNTPEGIWVLGLMLYFALHKIGPSIYSELKDFVIHLQPQLAQAWQKKQQTTSLNTNIAEDTFQADAHFNIENDIRNSAEILNKNLPMSVDRYTRLDNVIAGPGLLFTYNYTILTVTSREIDQAYLQDNKHDLKAEICSQPDMRIFFENKVITRYSYRGSDGGFIGNIDITPRDCGYGI